MGEYQPRTFFTKGDEVPLSPHYFPTDVQEFFSGDVREFAFLKNGKHCDGWATYSIVVNRHWSGRHRVWTEVAKTAAEARQDACEFARQMIESGRRYA